MAVVLNGTTNDITVNGVSVATDTEVSSAVASGVAPKVDLASFIGTNQGLTANGYQKLPGGLIIQWGTIAGLSQASGSYTGATFPIAFPNACLFVATQLGTNTPANGGGIFGITNKTTTNFTYYYHDTDSYLNSYYYFAIGY